MNNSKLIQCFANSGPWKEVINKRNPPVRQLPQKREKTQPQDELELKYYFLITELILTHGPNPHYCLHYVMLTYHLQNGGLPGILELEFHKASELESKWLEAAWQKSFSNKASLLWRQQLHWYDWLGDDLTSEVGRGSWPTSWHLFQEASREWQQHFHDGLDNPVISHGSGRDCIHY